MSFPVKRPADRTLVRAQPAYHFTTGGSAGALVAQRTPSRFVKGLYGKDPTRPTPTGPGRHDKRTTVF